MLNALILSLLTVAILMAFAVLFFKFIPSSGDKFHKLPREQKFGFALTVLCMAASWYYGKVLFGPEYPLIAKLLPIIIPAATVLSYIYLEYLFTRAVCGVLFLSTAHLLIEAFAEALPLRILLSLSCLSINFIGMWLTAQPWRFRDAIIKASENAAYAKKVAFSFAAHAALILIPLVSSYVL